MPLHGTVHYGQRYDNAFWDGEQMVFGDGDGTCSTASRSPLDVIGHELTHGVTEHEAGLDYHDQSGALNESVSDVFGSLVKQYALEQTAEQADWLIGAGLLEPGRQGQGAALDEGARHRLRRPVLGKDPQPAHMDDYVQTDEDNGGVHINSGIPNHAFYLAATALGGTPGSRPGASGTRRCATRRYARTRPSAEFADARSRPRGRSYGAGSEEANAVEACWAGVGVGAL